MPTFNLPQSAPLELRHLAGRADELASELRALAAQLEELPPPATAAAPFKAPPDPVREGRIWFTTAQAAQAATCHTATVLKACEAGELHGRQRTARGRWRIHADCLDAWIEGHTCPHMNGR